jgi:hypothetical protein
MYLFFKGTFKLKKNVLQSEGFDLNKVADPLYFLNAKIQKYVRMDLEMYRDIISGKVKL